MSGAQTTSSASALKQYAAAGAPPLRITIDVRVIAFCNRASARCRIIRA
jgi:hypothetical protein